MTVSFTTAAALVNELMEARDERRLLRVQKQMANAKLLIIDELGFVPLQRQILEAAARRPRDRDELVDRLRDGGF
jgi:DNA replication protein DnaC